MLKLNLACGTCKLEGYLNVDVNPEMNPDFVLDVAGILPWKDNEVDEIIFFHAIEHIEAKYHPLILDEFWRILKPEGILILGYPEFSICAKYWLDNYCGKREFWAACIFGRQCDPKDFHVSLMHTPSLKEILRQCGFKMLVAVEETSNPQYTVLKGFKGAKLPSYEEVTASLIFGEPKHLEVKVDDAMEMKGN